MGNDAIYVNPVTDGSVRNITSRGSSWLFAVTAIMLVADIVVFAWHLMIPRGQRVFHQIALIVLTTASIAYFCMASNLGYTGIATEFSYGGYPAGTLRQIWYVRYIDWVITTPGLLMELVLASGLPLSDIITLIFFDEVMIIAGLVGALVASTYGWAFFVGSLMAEFYILYVLLGPARQTAGVIGVAYKKSFTWSALILIVLWLLYPVAWGLSDHSSLISPDSEMIFYGILDILAKPVFIFYHLWSLSKLDLTALQLHSGKFSASAVGPAPHDYEKQPRLTAVDNTPRQPRGVTEAVNNAGYPATNTTQKKSMFSRKGKYDAPATGAADTYSRDGAAHNIAVGRPSEGTIVSERA